MYSKHKYRILSHCRQVELYLNVLMVSIKICYSLDTRQTFVFFIITKTIDRRLNLQAENVSSLISRKAEPKSHTIKPYKRKKQLSTYTVNHDIPSRYGSGIFACACFYTFLWIHLEGKIGALKKVHGVVFHTPFLSISTL